MDRTQLIIQNWELLDPCIQNHNNQIEQLRCVECNPNLTDGVDEMGLIPGVDIANPPPPQLPAPLPFIPTTTNPRKSAIVKKLDPYTTVHASNLLPQSSTSKSPSISNFVGTFDGAPKPVLLPHPSTWSPNKHNATATFISNCEGGHDEVRVLSHATEGSCASPKMLESLDVDTDYIDDDDLVDTLQSVKTFPIQKKSRSKKETQSRKRGNAFFDEEEDENTSGSQSEGDSEVLYIDCDEVTKAAECKRNKCTTRIPNVNAGVTVKGKGKGVGKSSLKKM